MTTVNRRDFLSASMLASAAVCVTGVAPKLASAAAPGTLALQHFVFDNRFEDCAAVAAHAGRQGVATIGFAGDLTHVWYDELDLAWRREPTAIAGITTPEGLFVLQTLAADHRMRLVYRGEHALPQAGRVAHQLKGPAMMLTQAVPTVRGQRWHATLASAMTRLPATAATPVTSSALTSAHASRERTLVSWIIAPRSAALARI